MITKVEKIKEFFYPISLNYGKKDWNIISALREFLSNMLDTKVEHSISYNKGTAVIEDNGDGLPMTSFIFGESTRDDSQIGQFGEGLKMAFITLLRENRKVSIETVGFNVEILAVEALGKKLLTVRFHDNKVKKGTKIFVECTETEVKEAQNLFLELTDIEKVDQNVFLPAGNIFIVGLKTTSLPNMLFSYNIPDKTMTNRDRNIVDTAKLMANMVKLLEGAKNQKFIKTYLTAFQTETNAYEYQLVFRIPASKIEFWKKAMAQQFPKGCLSSDLKSDLYASAMGYTVLRNVPSNLLQVFKQLGMKNSDVYASSYKGEAFQAKNKLIYPIGEDYVKDWSRSDAIREIISNALDAGEPRISHDGKKARISDSGQGIMKQHLVLGVSQKSSNHIGQFGEGMKMGALVLARTGTPVTIESVGLTYECKLEYNEEFKMKLFVVEYKKNARNKGTSIVFDCKAEELEQTQNRFIQFKSVSKKPIASRDGNLDVYLDQVGQLYIQGVKTSDIKSIFGYNVKDKTVLNGRDRNNYHSAILNQHISNLFKYTDNVEIIKQFLTNWESNSNKIEYEISFYPFTYTPWVKAVKSIFPKACFATGGTGEEDFIARTAGYKILRNIPSSVRNILENGGINSSTVVASKYKNKGILLENRIVYPITSDYGKDWDVIKALKELISNALDADKKTSITYKDGEMTIQDKGEGLSKHNLLFGSTTKKDGDDNIGIFGEGLKMASLVLARNNRQFKLVTKGFEYTAKIERDRIFNADVLVIDLKPCRKRIGTDIFVKVSEKETSEAKNYFLAFNKEYLEVADSIFTFQTKSPHKIGLFVNGMFISTLPSMFSYNIANKAVVGRDRQQLDMDLVKAELTKLWNKCGEKKAIEQLLTMTNDHLESQLNIMPNASVRSIWSQIITKVFGKICFSIGTEHDQVAKDRGFKLLLQNNPGLVKILALCGVKPSDQVVTLKGDEKVVQKRVDEKDLSPAAKRRLEKAKAVFTTLYGVNLTKRIEIITFQSDYAYQENGSSTLGLYNNATDMIYLNVDLLEKQEKYSFETLLGTMLHEQQHRKTGAHDCTREFEWGLSMELGRLATMLEKMQK